MQVDVFHAGSLGGIPDQMKNVFTGAQDMHLQYPEFLSGLLAGGEADLRAVSVPFDQQHLQAYYKSALFKPAIDKLTALGSINLDPDWTWWIKDPRGLIATRAVLTPADLDGHEDPAVGGQDRDRDLARAGRQSRRDPTAADLPGAEAGTDRGGAGDDRHCVRSEGR